METIHLLIDKHPVIAGIVIMWLVGNAVSAMPTPKSTASPFYDWFFKFLQPVGSAIPRLVAIYFPQYLQMFTGQKVNGNTPSTSTTASSTSVPNPEQPNTSTKG